MRLYGEISIDRTGAQTMLYLTCTMIFSLDLAHYGVSCIKKIEYLWIVVQIRKEDPGLYSCIYIYKPMGSYVPYGFFQEMPVNTVFDK